MWRSAPTLPYNLECKSSGAGDEERAVIQRSRCQCAPEEYPIPNIRGVEGPFRAHCTLERFSRPCGTLGMPVKIKAPIANMINTRHLNGVLGASPKACFAA